jgi:hemoglobin
MKEIFSRLRSVVPVAFVFVLLLAAGSVSAQTKEKPLYERLGGYDAIAAVTDDFAARLATDKKLGKFFVGLSDDSMKRLRQHVVDFLCVATGGPCVYTGRDMKTSHTGLEITEEEWDISVKHLVATLDKFKVPEKEKSEVLTAVGGLKKDIVEKAK